jgi:transcription initiation factor TFIIIB Brf1 subunit/transcription initiation factor TFIIB
MSRNTLTNKIIFKKFQLKLKLNQETIDFSQKVYNELNEKIFFKSQSVNLTIAISIFLASRFKGKQKSLKEISEVFQIKENVLDVCCEMALDEIKTTLVYTS